MRREWNPLWTRWGYTPDGVRRGVDPVKHVLHQCGQTPGINQEVFWYWIGHGVRRVRVVCTDGSIFTADLVNLAHHQRRRHINYREPQWGWPRNAWDYLPPVADGQLGLFA